MTTARAFRIQRIFGEFPNINERFLKVGSSIFYSIRVQQTSRVAFDGVAILSIRRGRLPTVRDTAFEQFVGCRMFVPDGDRRHGSESGCVVNQKDIAIRNDDVVCEFILREHLSNRPRMHVGFRLCRRPRENVRQAFMTGDLSTIDIAQSFV